VSLNYFEVGDGEIADHPLLIAKLMVDLVDFYLNLVVIDLFLLSFKIQVEGELNGGLEIS